MTDSTLLGVLHNDTYFTRMASSVGDKIRLLDWLVPGPVLDVGAGNGALVAAARTYGHDAIGVDASTKAVARSDGLVIHGHAPGLTTLFGTEPRFANIIFCSVLHEIDSYHAPDGEAAVAATIREASQLLLPGGRILVRDGVAPSDPDTPTRVRFHSPRDGARFHAAWHAQSANLGPNRASAHTHIGEDGHLYGKAVHTTEFLLTYVWGWDSLAREAHEAYTVAGPLVVRGAELAAWANMNVTAALAYTQPGYVTHLDALCQYEHTPDPTQPRWEPRPTPDTNAIWILSKPR